MGEGHDTHLAEPVPLALLAADNIHSHYAIEGFERAGRKMAPQNLAHNPGAVPRRCTEPIR